MFNYAVLPTETGLNQELDVYYPEHGTFLKGSFHVDENHVDLIWGGVSEEGLPTGEMVFMKLQRVE